MLGLMIPSRHAEDLVLGTWRRHLAVPIDQELRFRKALLKLGYVMPGQPTS